MDQTTRLQYLEAMGIDVWVSRDQPVAANQAADPSANYATANDLPILPEASPSSNQPANVAQEQLLHSSTKAGMATDNDEWSTLQQDVSLCRRCKLCETRTQTVFGVGNHHAGWMLIGEAPGQDEDLQGEPFVGRAGKLLNEMLRAIGLAREEVYIANMLKCRPPRNRDPEVAEVAACRPFLQQQIELLQPKLIVAVGRIAAQNLLQTQKSLTLLRGSRHQLGDTPLVVIPHPAYLLRFPLEKAKAWEDLQFARSLYKTLE